MQFWQRLGSELVIILVVILGLTGCSEVNHQASSKKIKVVSSVNFYGETAKAVLGHYGKATNLINNSTQDPHDFTPTPRDAEAVTNANLIVSNGLGYDSWMNGLARDAKHSGQLKVGSNVDHLTFGANPHVWYNPKTMSRLAGELAKKFGQIQPAHRRFFTKNARKYQRSLAMITTQINWIKHHRQNSRVDVSEPVFDYSLSQMGYQVHDPGFAKAVENGSDPTPEEIHRVRNDLTHHRIAFWVQNTQAESSITKNLVQLAKTEHVPILRVTETMPNHSNYQNWLMKQNYALEQIQVKERQP